MKNEKRAFQIARALEDNRMIKNKQEAIILYSGGLDSSAVAAVYGHRRYDTLHLLTFDNGTQSNIELAEVRIPSFGERFKNTNFIHETLSTKYLFKKIALNNITEDILKYETNLVCVGCKMAMHAEALVYALDNGIDEIVDGFAERQERFPEQDISFVNEMKRVHAKYGIEYKSPLYNRVKSKEDVKELLFMYDLSTKSIEPNCILGGTFSPAEKHKIRGYFKEKEKFIDDYISQHIKELKGEL